MYCPRPLHEVLFPEGVDVVFRKTASNGVSESLSSSQIAASTFPAQASGILPHLTQRGSWANWGSCHGSEIISSYMLRYLIWWVLVGRGRIHPHKDAGSLAHPWPKTTHKPPQMQSNESPTERRTNPSSKWSTWPRESGTRFPFVSCSIGSCQTRRGRGHAEALRTRGFADSNSMHSIEGTASGWQQESVMTKRQSQTAEARPLISCTKNPFWPSSCRRTQTRAIVSSNMGGRREWRRNTYQSTK